MPPYAPASWLGHRRYPESVLAASVSRQLLAVSLLVSTWLATSSPALGQESSAEPARETASPTATGTPTGVPTADTRPEGSWEVKAYDAWAEGLVEPRPNTNLTMDLLTRGRLEGETGCGDYLGGYSVEGERIGLGVITRGYQECGGKRVEEAVAFTVALEAVASWRPGSDGLELLDEEGRVRVVLERPLYADVVGDWMAEGYVRSNGTMAEPLAEAPITITFRADGSLSGSSGCRFLEGRYAGEGDHILVGPVDTVGPSCEGDERKQERRLFRLFGEIAQWQRDAEGLTLTDALGGPLLVLRSADVVGGDETPMPSEDGG